MRQGIALCDPCHNCLISGNIISDAVTGILLWTSHNNTITGNKVYRCSRFGIDVGGDHNEVKGNHIEDNYIGIMASSYFNHVKYNNFIKNEHLHMVFSYGTFDSPIQRLTNRWFGNYWGRPRLLPYPVLGAIFLLPTIQFDWRPALLPYDI